jgi:hypothetical protein
MKFVPIRTAIRFLLCLVAMPFWALLGMEAWSMYLGQFEPGWADIPGFVAIALLTYMVFAGKVPVFDSRRDADSDDTP